MRRLSSFLLGVLFGVQTQAQATEASVNLSAEYTSEYVFRGITFSGEAIQPAVEASLGGITIGAWSSLAIGDDQDVFTDQVDLYINSSWELSDFLTGEIGATLYHFPDSGGLFDIGSDDEDASTVELYGGLDFDILLSPSVTAFYDIHLETITVEGSAQYDISILTDLIFRASVTAGLVEAETGGLDYQYGRLSIKSFYDVTDRASLFAGFHYGLSSEDTFLDTDFNLEDINSLQDPRKTSTWFSVGVTTQF